MLTNNSWRKSYTFEIYQKQIDGWVQKKHNSNEYGVVLDFNVTIYHMTDKFDILKI